jgi:hypothetical protein
LALAEKTGNGELVQHLSETQLQVSDLARKVSSLGNELRETTMRMLSKEHIVDYEALGDKILHRIEQQLEATLPAKIIQSPGQPDSIHVHPAFMQYLSDRSESRDVSQDKEIIMAAVREEMARIETVMQDRERSFRDQLRNGDIRIDLHSIEQTMVRFVICNRVDF